MRGLHPHRLAVAALIAACWSGNARADEDALVLRLSTSLHALPSNEAAPALQRTLAEAARGAPGSGPCIAPAAPSWDRLTLGDALTVALCQSPSLRQAMATVAELSTGVDIAERGRWPTWNASLGYDASRNFNASGNSGRTLEATLGLSWVLFDFGQTRANIQAARQALIAGMAQQDDALLEQVRELLRLYTEAVVTSATLDALTEAETTASRTAAAAQARYEAKIGSQIERLQARTAWAQARVERVRAEGDWESARGNLALALGAPVQQPLRPAPWEAWSLETGPAASFEALTREARTQHPKLRALQAQRQSLQARLEAVKSDAKGRVTLSGNGGSSRNWGAAGSGTLPAASSSLTLNLPLFNGRETQAQVAQIQAQIAAREAELEAAQRQVDSALWQAQQALRTSDSALSASEQLLASAQNTYRVAQGRYDAGVGAILELLTAQSGLADARRQGVTARMDRLTAVIQASLATGRLGPKLSAP